MRALAPVRAHPGPVCYRKGGPLAVTDANVFLGRIQPHLFPAIFGPQAGATYIHTHLTFPIHSYLHTYIPSYSTCPTLIEPIP